MADPLDQVEDQRRRLQLLWLRAQEGEVLYSSALREKLDGFKAQMGIYKPSGSRHALWVRETIQGPYEDKPPTGHADGSWMYLYSPEGRDGRPDMSLATNKALLQCMDDGVPVGVLRQRRMHSEKAAYEIRGLAYVEGFDGVHFHLRSEAIAVDQRPAQEDVIPFVAFEEKRVAVEVRQQRDARFGIKVRQAYRERCAACELGFRVRGATIGLEAAHIIPATDRGTSLDVRNGILLCANHHALMDGFGWALDEDLRVVLAADQSFRKSAAPNHILSMEGRRLPNLPEDEGLWPAPQAVQFRLKQFSSFWEAAP